MPADRGQSRSASLVFRSFRLVVLFGGDRPLNQGLVTVQAMLRTPPGVSQPLHLYRVQARSVPFANPGDRDPMSTVVPGRRLAVQS
jgi:hypothetical protein